MAALKEFIRTLIVLVLAWEARMVVRKYKPSIIAVTGSVGKTSTKDAVYSALASKEFVRKSEKSFNSDIGVPLTVLGLPNGWSSPFIWLKNILEGLSLILVNAPYPAWLVLEVGADRPGDITRALSWLSPDVVVATRFPDIPVHVEFYDSPEEVHREEAAPIGWLKAGGVLVKSAIVGPEGGIEAPEGASVITYGFDPHATVKGARYLVTSKHKAPTGISFDVSYEDERVHVSLPGVVGKPHAEAVLSGIAAAVGVGVPFQTAAAAFVHHAPPPGRMRIIPGLAGSTVIDDSYNSSPVASVEALAALKDAPHAHRRIAVLGDMLELGMYAVPEHRRVGEEVSKSADALVTVGVRARDIAKGAKEAGMPDVAVTECDNSADAAAVVPHMIKEGDVVLVKGSQSMRMERVVKALMVHPEEAETLLVRQDTEWQNR